MKTPKILIVDDEPRSREGLKRRLEAWDSRLLEVYTAVDAKEALETASSISLDVLITDIRMPEMTGLELIEKIRTFQEVPACIVISAYSEFDYAQKAIHMGVVNYLLKPVRKQEFLDTVEEALSRREQQQKLSQVERAMEDPALSPQSDLPPPLEEALSIIEERLSEKFSLREIAGDVHLNPSYLSVLFKEQMGMTFSEYITRRRLQQAKRLLLTTDFPVGDIAEKTGYQTAKYFIRIFREYEGTTPSKYRKAARGDE
ncbi:response regulator transcription factor [Alkalicoccus urumqiensis]|uniref:DNA-binding response regulator n=1 Tax=Alkalicoccus urumqiensis TaxID=1548213 RepID=A0A2P6MIB7_ALKUR|nr:response regulator [Alkalicoccus urumqiensis]PRO66036.1 DNA-binding response regulator [Alkalicoccus urumqiensis]